MRSRSPFAAITAASFTFCFAFLSFTSHAEADEPTPPQPPKVNVRIDTDGQDLEVFDETNIVSMAPVRYRNSTGFVRTPEYERICAGPASCATSLTTGAHTFAVSRPGESLTTAGPLTIEGPSKIQARIASTPGDLGLGILVGGGFLAAGIAMTAAGAGQLDACGEGCTHGQKSDGTALVAIGVITAVLGPILGLVIASPRDHVEVSVTPLFAGPMAALRESNGLAAIRPEGVAFTVRF